MTGARGRIYSAMDGEGWSGRIVIEAQGGRAAELRDALARLARSAARQAGLTPDHVEPDGLFDRLGAREQTAPIVAQAERFGERQRFLSYAREDNESGRIDVDGFQRRAAKAGLAIRRDEQELGLGDSIAAFAQAMSEGDRIYVMLSAAYLKSPWCIDELTRLWIACGQNREAFREKVMVYLHDPDLIRTQSAIKAHVDDVTAERDALQALVAAGQTDPDGYKEFSMLNDALRSLHPVLSCIRGHIQPSSIDELLAYGVEHD